MKVVESESGGLSAETMEDHLDQHSTMLDSYAFWGMNKESTT
jgi:hypothetical protein